MTVVTFTLLYYATLNNNFYYSVLILMQLKSTRTHIVHGKKNTTWNSRSQFTFKAKNKSHPKHPNVFSFITVK